MIIVRSAETEQKSINFPAFHISSLGSKCNRVRDCISSFERGSAGRSLKRKATNDFSNGDA